MATKPKPVKPTRAAMRAARKVQRTQFKLSKNAHGPYAKQLRSVATQVGKIVRKFVTSTGVTDPHKLIDALQRYAEILTPWAQRVAESLLSDVNIRDTKSWERYSSNIGLGIKKEIRNAPVGNVMRDLMQQQVTLIKSLPIQAAERVHHTVITGLAKGQRADVVAAEILRTGLVTKSRAMLIARTETSRAATSLTRARAEYIGSEQYIWRSSGDSDVRPLHRKLNGKVFYWHDPPIADESGIRAAPGSIWNCRCYAEPILKDAEDF